MNEQQNAMAFIEVWRDGWGESNKRLNMICLGPALHTTQYGVLILKHLGAVLIHLGLNVSELAEHANKIGL